MSIAYRRPPLTGYQLAALFHDARYGIVEASSKAGKTYAALAWLFEQAAVTGKAGRNYWWVAPVYPQSKIAYRRLKLATPPALRKANDTELTITLPNGTALWFKSGEKPDNLFGEDVYAVVVDEASRLREEAWFAVRSTLTKTRGMARIIGNVKGRRNWAYQLARRAEAGDPEMRYSMINAAMAVEAGILAAEEIEDARRTLPEAVFKELYLCQPSEDGSNPFGLKHIGECIAPMSGNPPITFGVDLARSMDYTVGIGLDERGAVCRFDRFQMPWNETIARVRALVGSTPALVDSTGVGDAILDGLQRGGTGYTRYEGYRFDANSKQKLMEGLAVAIQSRTVSFPDGPIVAELQSYEYEHTRTGMRYSAPQGLHDDCVCALALAVQHWGQRHRLRPYAACSSDWTPYQRPKPDWAD